MKQKAASILVPGGSSRRRLLRKVLISFRLYKPPVNQHHAWFTYFEQSYYPESKFTFGPLISVVVPCYNTRHQELLEMVYSVIGQFYQSWELILVNASGTKKSIKQIEEVAEIDTRIKIVRTNNNGISRNTNAGIKVARGSFVALLDHDDTLAPFALYEVAKAIRKSPTAGLIYSDEDKITADSELYFGPFFKPDYSPELLTNVNYITHLSVIRTDLLNEVGGFDPNCDGAQDYDLFLKIIDTGANVVHIPKILYHWRATRGSTALNISSKKYVMEAGVQAVKAHVKRKNRAARITSIKDRPNFVKVDFSSKANYDIVFMPSESILQRSLYIRKFIKKIPKEVANIYCPDSSLLKKEISTLDKRSIFVEANNSYLGNVLSRAKTDNIVIINDYVSFKKPSWMNELIGVLQSPGIFTVSPVIIDKHKRIKDSGYIWSQGLLVPFLSGVYLTHDTPFGYAGWVRSVVCGSRAAFVIKKSSLQAALENNLNIFDPVKCANYNKQNEMRDVVWTHTRGCINGNNIHFGEKQGDPALKVDSIMFEPTILPSYAEHDYDEE